MNPGTSRPNAEVPFRVRDPGRFAQESYMDDVLRVVTEASSMVDAMTDLVRSLTTLTDSLRGLVVSGLGLYVTVRILRNR